MLRIYLYHELYELLSFAAFRVKMCVLLYIRCLLICYCRASSFQTRPDEIDREYSVSNKKETYAFVIFHHFTSL